MATHDDPRVGVFVGSRSPGGPVAAAVTTDLAEMALRGPVDASLAATAVTLACALDAGAGLATAAVARELRSTLLALAAAGGESDDGTQEFVADLSAPVFDWSR